MTEELQSTQAREVAPCIGIDLSSEFLYRLGMLVEQGLRDGVKYAVTTEAVRRAMIGSALKKANGVKSRAAARLGISRKHLHNELRRSA
jgi:DNA-binding NtrC family response regulator